MNCVTERRLMAKCILESSSAYMIVYWHNFRGGSPSNNGRLGGPQPQPFEKKHVIVIEAPAKTIEGLFANTAVMIGDHYEWRMISGVTRFPEYGLHRYF